MVSKAANFTIGAGKTISRNYQSKRAEFAIDVEGGNAADLRDATVFVKIYTLQMLKEKIGITRAEADRLAKKFYGVSWRVLIKGEPEEEES